jgi:hypothetical protein
MARSRRPDGTNVASPPRGGPHRNQEHGPLGSRKAIVPRSFLVLPGRGLSRPESAITSFQRTVLQGTWVTIPDIRYVRPEHSRLISPALERSSRFLRALQQCCPVQEFSSHNLINGTTVNYATCNGHEPISCYPNPEKALSIRGQWRVGLFGVSNLLLVRGTTRRSKRSGSRTRITSSSRSLPDSYRRAPTA